MGHSGDYGLYAVFEQKLYRVGKDDDRGIGVFARASYGPSDRNPIDLYADGGLVTSRPRLIPLRAGALSCATRDQGDGPAPAYLAPSSRDRLPALVVSEYPMVLLGDRVSRAVLEVAEDVDAYGRRQITMLQVALDLTG
ncbi:carbohydrate porin [Bradyrhizobium sp. Arg816]|uniref:carbohydrate porin n=1 Tax=Bradyrhizobium sp. Arg816 TaxID=2998491 RepID=UPI00249F4433|nr:carbohydrate porin [Bradyrhizobium sp. Arg816]MDI3566834.1 carbohydrate porin [Bradyrhizobium sp. Arg816]